MHTTLLTKQEWQKEQSIYFWLYESIWCIHSSCILYRQVIPSATHRAVYSFFPIFFLLLILFFQLHSQLVHSLIHFLRCFVVVVVVGFFVGPFWLLGNCIKDRADLCLFWFALNTLDGVRQINFNTNDMSTVSTRDYANDTHTHIRRETERQDFSFGCSSQQNTRGWNCVRVWRRRLDMQIAG